MVIKLKVPMGGFAALTLMRQQLSGHTEGKGLKGHYAIHDLVKDSAPAGPVALYRGSDNSLFIKFQGKMYHSEDPLMGDALLHLQKGSMLTYSGWYADTVELYERVLTLMTAILFGEAPTDSEPGFKDLDSKAVSALSKLPDGAFHNVPSFAHINSAGNDVMMWFYNLVGVPIYKLSPEVVAAFAPKVEPAEIEVLTKVEDAEDAGPPAEPMDPKPKKAGKAASKDKSAGGLAQFPTASLKAARVPLSAAEKMYQPVFGTDEGSRYYAIGFTPELAVAVRIKSNRVSFRVEPREGGQLTKEQQDILTRAGLNCAGDRASIHLEGHDSLKRERIVGALMIAIPGMISPQPDLSKLEGA